MAGLFSADAWEKVWTFRGTFFLGVEHTLMTAVFALFISLLLGIAFGLMSTGRNKALRAIARVYVEFIQNTPLLLQICFLYYALAFSGNSIGIIATGIIALGVYHGAYVAEVIRAGIEAIPKGQFEAAESQGFDYFRNVLYYSASEREDYFASHGESGCESGEKHLLPLHYWRNGFDFCYLQLCNRSQYRWRLCTGVSAQRPAFLCYLLPSVHTGKRVGELVKEAGCKSDCDRRSCSIKERGE